MEWLYVKIIARFEIIIFSIGK